MIGAIFTGANNAICAMSGMVFNVRVSTHFAVRRRANYDGVT